MNAFLLLAVLTTAQVQVETTPSWYEDYGAALKEAKRVGKPLLIVIEQPKAADARIEQISHRDDDRQEQLLARYILCRIDAGTEYGQEVAKAFNTSRLPYTAVIDKTASAVLFTRTGQFSSNQWTAMLARYQRGVQPVSYQQTVATQYQQYQPMAMQYYQPAAMCRG